MFLFCDNKSSLLFWNIFKLITFILYSIVATSRRWFSWKCDAEKVCSFSTGKSKFSLICFISSWRDLHVLYYVVLGILFTFLASGFFHRLQSLLVNPCHHDAFGSWIGEDMTSDNKSINIGLNVFINCTIIRRIVIKTNLHWPNIFFQCSILFSEVDLVLFCIDAVFLSVIVKRYSISFLIEFFKIQICNLQFHFNFVQWPD